VTDTLFTSIDINADATHSTTTVLVRYFAGAMAAAGVAEELLELPAGGRVADALALVAERRGPELVRVLPACSYLLDGIAVHDHETVLPNGAELDVLPPFAGG
jgi:molybdopterin synthase sulfur carrier subunit